MDILTAEKTMEEIGKVVQKLENHNWKEADKITISNPYEKVIAISKCVAQYNMIGDYQKRTAYIAQRLRDEGFEGHITYNTPRDEKQGALFGWEYGDETYTELKNKKEIIKTRRVVIKQGEMVLGIDRAFEPYLFPAVAQLIEEKTLIEERLKATEEKLALL